MAQFRTVSNYQISSGSDSSCECPGMYNPHRTLTYKTQSGTHTVCIGSGNSDRVDVFRAVGSEWRYVLTQNTSLGYVGLEVYGPTNNGRHERLYDVFCQSDHELEDYLGAAWRALRPVSLVRRLADHLG